MLQRAVEEDVTTFLGRARYERTPEARGSRNGNRPRQVQTAEGELEIQVPQIRGAAEKFMSSVIPNGRTALRTRPLEALIIGGWVRGLSDRDIESLVREAGLGQISKSTVSQITQELRARYQASRAPGLGEVELLVLFCDAIYLPTRPSGAKEGVLVAWGYDETGRRVLLDVVLGQRERFEDWLEMGRGLVRRGPRAPMLVVTDGAPGLIRAMEERGRTAIARGAPSTAGGTWPASYRRTTSSSMSGWRRPTGPRSTRQPRRRMARPGCDGWSATWSARWRRSSGGRR